MALNKKSVVEHALKIGDAEGLDAVTVRRLAQELGVTPMALYWHFKNKDLLFIGMIDELMADACVDIDTEPWLSGVRLQVEALLRSLRAHPFIPELLQVTEKYRSENFARVAEIALTFLTRGGFSLGHANAISSYLLQGTCALIANQPCPERWSSQGPAEWRHQHRRQLQAYPPADFPQLNALAELIDQDTDMEEYFTFGVDLLIAGVETMANRGR